jgi:hypothetical protein
MPIKKANLATIGRRRSNKARNGDKDGRDSNEAAARSIGRGSRK